mmetsp:Transcript_27237/g.52813  ORF Transcript_27237/g.52813 Transcript_27237/m.52813 type:complete len:505 (-) Transcript_27237:708-2222(-)
MDHVVLLLLLDGVNRDPLLSEHAQDLVHQASGGEGERFGALVHRLHSHIRQVDVADPLFHLHGATLDQVQHILDSFHVLLRGAHAFPLECEPEFLAYFDEDGRRDATVLGLIPRGDRGVDVVGGEGAEGVDCTLVVLPAASVINEHLRQRVGGGYSRGEFKVHWAEHRTLAHLLLLDGSGHEEHVRAAHGDDAVERADVLVLLQRELAVGGGDKLVDDRKKVPAEPLLELFLVLQELECSTGVTEDDRRGLVPVLAVHPHVPPTLVPALLLVEQVPVQQVVHLLGDWQATVAEILGPSFDGPRVLPDAGVVLWRVLVHHLQAAGLVQPGGHVVRRQCAEAHQNLFRGNHEDLHQSLLLRPELGVDLVDELRRRQRAHGGLTGTHGGRVDEDLRRLELPAEDVPAVGVDVLFDLLHPHLLLRAEADYVALRADGLRDDGIEDTIGVLEKQVLGKLHLFVHGHPALQQGFGERRGHVQQSQAAFEVQHLRYVDLPRARTPGRLAFF